MLCLKASKCNLAKSFGYSKLQREWGFTLKTEALNTCKEKPREIKIASNKRENQQGSLKNWKPVVKSEFKRSTDGQKLSRVF